MSSTARILVVEDDSLHRRSLVRAVEREGHEAVAVCDGLEARELLESEPFDLVLTDLRMPRRNGVELLLYVKDHFATMPVIILTAHRSAQSATSAAKLGAFCYLTKPVSLEKLRDAVRRAVGGGQPRRKPQAEQGRPSLLGVLDTLPGCGGDADTAVDGEHPG